MRIGIDLGGTKIEIIALNHRGDTLFSKRIKTPKGSYQDILSCLCQLIAETEKSCKLAGDIGIGTPGSCDLHTGLLRNSNTTCLNGMPFKADLEARLKRPVRMANDANCFALSEAMDGAGKGANSLFGVIIGTGTGGGLVINRQLLVGVNAIAGEWGHNPLPWPSTEELPGPPCYCGRRGCIETFLSGPGLSADYHSATQKVHTGPQIAALAEQGEKAAEVTLQRYEGRLARGLASVINLVDPEIIVLGGGLSNLKRLYKNIPQLWAPYIFSEHIETRLLPAKHGDASGVRGAAWLWPLPTE